MLSGQVLSGKFGEALDVRVERAVGEKAQETWQDNRVVEPPGLDVGLADHHDARPCSRLEMAFHCRQRHGLVLGDEFGLLIAGRERHQQARHESCCRADAQEDPRLFPI